MAGEVAVFYQSDITLYAVVRNESGEVWYVAGKVFEAWGTGGRTAADYDIALTDKTGGMFVGDFDANIDAGYYYIVAHQQAGGSPADTDPAINREYGYWTGSVWQRDLGGTPDYLLQDIVHEYADMTSHSRRRRPRVA